jgi:hypothetical protein
LVIKPKKQICSHLTSADQGGQKNHNGQKIAIAKKNKKKYLVIAHHVGQKNRN